MKLNYKQKFKTVSVVLLVFSSFFVFFQAFALGLNPRIINKTTDPVIVSCADNLNVLNFYEPDNFRILQVACGGSEANPIILANSYIYGGVPGQTGVYHIVECNSNGCDTDYPAVQSDPNYISESTITLTNLTKYGALASTAVGQVGEELANGLVLPLILLASLIGLAIMLAYVNRLLGRREGRDATIKTLADEVKKMRSG